MLLGILVAVVPLLIVPGTLFYFDVTPKVIALLIGAAIALPWMCLRGFPSGRLARWFYMLVAAQALSLGIATLGSRQVRLSVIGSNWRTLGLLPHLVLLLLALAVFTYAAGDASRVLRVLRAISTAGSLAAVYGIVQYFGWDPWQPSRAYHVGEGIWEIVRPPGPLGHADYFAAYLVFVAFTGVTLAMNDRGAFRALGAAAAAVAAAAVVLSGTRGALVGLIAGGAFLVVRFRPRPGLRQAAACAAVAALAVTFYVSPFGLALRSRVHWVSEDIWGGSRLLLWRDSAAMAARHWALGWGPETYPAEFPRFESARLAQVYPDYYYESPHDIFLDAWLGQGVAGVAILIVLAGLAVWAGWGAGPLGAGLSAALLGALAAHVFTVWIVVTALYFYLFLAMLVALRCSPGRGQGSRLAAYASLPVAAVILLFALRMLAADRLLAVARRDLETGATARAAAHYDQARRFGLEADLWWARNLSPDAMADAIDAARRATAGEDRQNAWYTLAWLYARQGDVPHAEQALRATLACAPNWFKPHWMLSQILWREGRAAAALAEADRAAYLNAGRNPEVARSANALRASVRAR